MSTETYTRKGLLNAGLSGPQNFYYQQQLQQQHHHHHHHHIYNPAPRLSALASPHLSAARIQAKQARPSPRRSPTGLTRQQRRASQQLQPQPLHPLATLVAVVFDFFLRGILDMTWPFRELVRMVVRGVFASLVWAYHALPLPFAMGLLYFGFQSVPEALRNVEELRAMHSMKLNGGFTMVGNASGVDGLYALGEIALVRWGDVGVSSAFYCLSLMTAAYAVMLLRDMRDYLRDTWALIRDEALEVKALRADQSS